MNYSNHPGRPNRRPARSETLTLVCPACGDLAMDVAVLVAQDGEVQHHATGGCLSCGTLLLLSVETLQAVVDARIADANLNGL